MLYLSHIPLSAVKVAQIRGLSAMLHCVPCLVVPHDICEMTQALLPEAQVVSEREMGVENLAHEPVKMSHLLASWIATQDFCAVFASHTPLWMRVISLMAAAFDVPYIGGMMTRALPKIQRTICAGRFIETLEPPQKPFCATVADDDTALSPSGLMISGKLGRSEKLAGLAVPALEAWTSFEQELVRLDGARIVFAGGRGLGSKEAFDKLARCAARYGAGLAASRLAVDLGWCRNDIQVGQTGLSIAPEIYVAFGISGAIQHVAGIRNARQIIAINTDKDAPIFHFADIGIIADAMEIMDQILAIRDE